MTDFVDSVMSRIGFSGGAAKALQFMVGLVLAAISVQNYSPNTQALSFIGIIFGGYLILKAIQ